MVSSFKLKPIAQCTYCHKTTHNKARIDLPCYEQTEKGHCEGFFKAKPNEDDWAPCVQCNGTGSIERSRRCTDCKGDGWTSIKMELPVSSSLIVL
jgi:DnaJ-class molecular chaperone